MWASCSRVSLDDPLGTEEEVRETESKPLRESGGSDDGWLAPPPLEEADIRPIQPGAFSECRHRETLLHASFGKQLKQRSVDGDPPFGHRVDGRCAPSFRQVRRWLLDRHALPNTRRDADWPGPALRGPRRKQRQIAEQEWVIRRWLRSLKKS